ncbi:MAG: HipA domain-containing protein [Rhodocyclaceae bacterium]|nr:HipA domain-containing protein [Rhodocyclaceae bacterium]
MQRLSFRYAAEWIAKFPKGDVVDIPLIEHATMKLATQAGIRTSETVAHKIGVGHVLLVKRFDRAGAQRIHALSAQSMLAQSTRVSYAGMAEVLRAKASPDIMNERRREVFARFAFNVLMDNTDDHEKNHAFVRLSDEYWDLSLAYDLLPQMNGTGVQGLPVGRKNGKTPLLSAIANHAEFGLSKDEAEKTWLHVATVVNSWREVFSSLGVSDRDIDYLTQFIDSQEKLALRKRPSSAS